jgi:hypothetical protein
MYPTMKERQLQPQEGNQTIEPPMTTRRACPLLQAPLQHRPMKSLKISYNIAK